MSWFIYRFPNNLQNDNFFSGSYIGRLMILERQMSEITANVQTLNQRVCHLEETRKDVESNEVEELNVE